ncbi:AraC family transcriptional regulator [Pseudoalteromonas luteoviolacea]|uniref:AraC family transcriptional regulator n=1 Tax=Pseudoalteromonas luteoviolacea TaxID=43657 RepID=A0A1C0TR07_9GAMM|nr:AraC family transcriptional regulator [Pseudoalteromonas luteoviolacea]OCQ21379.1 AraC family transcriptional regulator [Pseudoalteromonas luteoviolacea]
MKAMCEKVIPSSNCSWRYCLYQLNEIPFNWHYHPEYEICLTLNSQGVCHIGDYIASFGDYDLVLLGPELPHTWQSKPNSDGSIQKVHVAQIPALWLEQQLRLNRELDSLRSLLFEAKCGLKFDIQVAKEAEALFIQMGDANPLERYVLLFNLLNLMASNTYQTLSSMEFNFSNQQDPAKDKFDRVINFIYENYTEHLSADILAEQAHMSTNHFHRFFKKRTEKTVTEFINQLRIAKACKLLINSQAPITVISDQCGFNNLSNFNRRFLALKSCTPSQFRARVQHKALI